MLGKEAIEDVLQECAALRARRPGGIGQGQGPGRMDGTKAGAGPGGYCICPNCGHRAPHERGKPCYEVVCPKCGTRMVRE